LIGTINSYNMLYHDASGQVAKPLESLWGPIQLQDQGRFISIYISIFSTKLTRIAYGVELIIVHSFNLIQRKPQVRTYLELDQETIDRIRGLAHLRGPKKSEQAI
jgi:hypothetical protein